MILLSLVLVVVSATALAFGVFTTGAALVWTSLGAGLGAAALVTGSVVRRRRPPGAALDAGPESAGAVAAGPASAGDPTPSATTATGSPPTRPADPGPAPVRGPDPAPQPPDGAAWPWAPAPPGGSAARGWSGHVPSATPDPDRPAPPAAPPPEPAAVPVELAAEDGMEPVAMRDALRVAQLDDEVVVEDGRPRYHLAGCRTLDGAPTVTLPVSGARRGGFTPCAVCTPDRVLLHRHTDRGADPR